MSVSARGTRTSSRASVSGSFSSTVSHRGSFSFTGLSSPRDKDARNQNWKHTWLQLHIKKAVARVVAAAKARNTTVRPTTTGVTEFLQALQSGLSHGIRPGYCLWDVLDIVPLLVSDTKSTIKEQVSAVRAMRDVNSVRRKERAWLLQSLNTRSLYEQVEFILLAPQTFRDFYSPTAYLVCSDFRVPFLNLIRELGSLVFELPTHRAVLYDFLNNVIPTKTAASGDTAPPSSFNQPPVPQPSPPKAPSSTPSHTVVDSLERAAATSFNTSASFASAAPQNSFNESSNNISMASAPREAAAAAEGVGSAVSNASVVGAYRESFAEPNSAASAEGQVEGSPRGAASSIIVQAEPPTPRGGGDLEAQPQPPAHSPRGSMLGDESPTATPRSALTGESMEWNDSASALDSARVPDSARMDSARVPDSARHSVVGRGSIRQTAKGHEGKLNKKGEGLLAGYKSRYFRIEGFWLAYYENKSCKDEKGRIDLRDSVARVGSGAAMFYVEGPNTTRKFELQAATDLERLGWIRAINAVSTSNE